MGAGLVIALFLFSVVLFVGASLKSDLDHPPGVSKAWDPNYIPISLVIDSSLIDRRPEVVQATTRAIRWWNTASAMKLFRPVGEVGHKGHWCLILPFSPNTEWIEDSVQSIAYASLLMSDDGTIAQAIIYVNEELIQELGADCLFRAMAHEMGHLVGLDHDNDPKSVMYHTRQEGAFCLLEQDRERLINAYANTRD